MTIASFVRWNRTALDPEERSELLGALTPEQKNSLLHDDYAWFERSGVIWTPPDGSLRRARFTHYTESETRRGSFRIDSTGCVSEVPPRL